MLHFLGETHLPVDHQTYFLDLKKANDIGQANLQLEYSVKEDLLLSDLSPDSWYKYVKRLNVEPQLYNQFRKHYYRNGPELEVPCDTSCKEKLLCSLLTSEAQLVTKPEWCRFEGENHVSWWQSFW